MAARSMMLMALLWGVVSGRPADNGVPSVAVGQGRVSSSFGGYHASAGLGGAVNGDGAGGGLFAHAGTPDGALATAGLGGKAAGLPEGAGAGAGFGGNGGFGGFGGNKVPATKVQSTNTAAYYNVTTHKNSGFFNDIFNIPTSVLKAVNQFLNNKQAFSSGSATPAANHKVAPAHFKFQASAGVGAGHQAQKPCVGTDCAGVEKTGGQTDTGSHQVYAQKTVYKTANQEKTADVTVAAGVMKRPGFYDGVFNIPISALNAVNTFLSNFGR